MTSHPPDSVANVTASAATPPALADHPATVDTEAATPAELTAQPFVAIRHPRTGEITTTRYNANALRILLQAGFEEAPSCACPATEAGTDRTHAPARQPASCPPSTAPCTWAGPSASQ